jgi:hypothetical protein
MGERWTPATDADIVVMCERLILEPLSASLRVDAVVLLQRCRLLLDRSETTLPKQEISE